MAEFTKLTLENENGVYSVQIDRIEITLDEFFQELALPVLLAAQYSEKQVREALNG